MKKNLILLILFLLTAVISHGQNEKFQINGAARAYYFSNELDISKSIDTVTTRNANYGHTLLDLGVSLFPNKETEVISVFRIRNELGGFWGGGVSFNVRQLTLKGVAGGVLKYELGDIDLKMTPYTLHNENEEGFINEADAFSLRREIVHYDMFYSKDNEWRMQGAKANFGLKFNKGIKSLNFNGFITRQRVPNPDNSEPERLYGGGTFSIIQSDNFNIAFNSINLFDLTKTIGDDSTQFKNSVHTTNLNFIHPVNENLKVGLKGEGGISYSEYTEFIHDTVGFDVAKQNDEWFYDVALTSEITNKNITINLGYKDVGADFSSPGAQTKRINFSKFPGIYQQFTNDFTGRPISYSDMISGDAENSFRISEELLPYYAAYNNTNPYGLATPNRKGIYLDVSKSDSTKIKDAFIRVAALTQSRGTGTTQKKNFILAEAGTDIYINDFFSWEKQLKIDLGVRYENTTRGGEVYEKVNLNSTMIDLGVSYEFAFKLDLLFGAKLWTVSGSEITNERNQYNEIVDFDFVNYNFTENTIAAGLRYRFNDKNALTAQYQMFNIQHKDASLADYGINQFNILFSLFF